MKLLLYSHTFPPNIGGVETITRSLARGLAELRTASSGIQFEVSVVTQTARGGFDDSAEPFRIVRRPSWRELWRMMRATDVVHVAGPAIIPLMMARAAGKPVVIEHHGYQAICPNGVLVRQPDGTVCPGHFQERRYWICFECERSDKTVFESLLSLAAMFPRYVLALGAYKNLAITEHVLNRHKLPKSRVVYYGIEDPLMGERAVGARIKSSAGVCFAFVGRFVPEKGIPILLAATSRLTQRGCDLTVRLIGDGPERAKLERIIKEAGLSEWVHITGYVGGSELAEALNEVTAVVMPSIWEETAGLAAIEQMMRGRIVIASDIGGLREIVGEAGLHFPAGDANALAECMERVLREPAMVESLERAARKRALEVFLRGRMISEHAQVYAEAFEQSEH